MLCADVEMELVLQEVTGYPCVGLKQIYKLHENDKKRLYLSRVLEVERGTFTPLVFTTTGGMFDECQCYYSCLAELLAVKKQESYAFTIAWIGTRVSFAILRSALVCCEARTLGGELFPIYRRLT